MVDVKVEVSIILRDENITFATETRLLCKADQRIDSSCADWQN